IRQGSGAGALLPTTKGSDAKGSVAAMAHQWAGLIPKSRFVPIFKHKKYYLAIPMACSPTIRRPEVRAERASKEAWPERLGRRPSRRAFGAHLRVTGYYAATAAAAASASGCC